jgi:hypothetical protein
MLIIRRTIGFFVDSVIEIAMHFGLSIIVANKIDKSQ